MGWVVEMELTGRVAGGAVRRSGRVLAVAGMFGVPLTEEGRVLFEGVKLRVGAGEVVLITGASGSGKSTMLRRVERETRNAKLETRNRDEPRRQEDTKDHEELKVVRLGEISLEGDRAVVDCFGCSLEEALGHLARAGLAEARVLLRAPAELSEGEQFRYRVARFMASDWDVLIADEFCAVLDRVTAKVVSWQLGRFVRGSGKAVVAATTHEDLAGDLGPSVWVRQGWGRTEIVHC